MVGLRDGVEDGGRCPSCGCRMTLRAVFEGGGEPRGQPAVERGGLAGFVEGAVGEGDNFDLRDTGPGFVVEAAEIAGAETDTTEFLHGSSEIFFVESAKVQQAAARTLQPAMM